MKYLCTRSRESCNYYETIVCDQTWPPPTSVWYLRVKYSAASVIRLMLWWRPRRWRLKFSAAWLASLSALSSDSRPESFSMPASDSVSEDEEAIEEALCTLCIDVVLGQRTCPGFVSRSCSSLSLFAELDSFDHNNSTFIWFTILYSRYRSVLPRASLMLGCCLLFRQTVSAASPTARSSSRLGTSIVSSISFTVRTNVSMLFRMLALLNSGTSCLAIRRRLALKHQNKFFFFFQIILPFYHIFFLCIINVTTCDDIMSW